MKHTIKALILAAALLFASVADAGSSFSSGSRGGFSGGSRSVAAAPARSMPSQPSIQRSAPINAPRTTTTATRSTTTTNVTRSYSSRVNYGSPYHYGGFGMGYGYSNGIMTGIIIGSMMHPMNTVMYTGGGMYNNNALLYPDGRVVSQQGQLLGTYTNGAFINVANGPQVAIAAPADAFQPASPQPTQVIVQKDDATEIILITIMLSLLAVIAIFFVMGLL